MKIFAVVFLALVAYVALVTANVAQIKADLANIDRKATDLKVTLAKEKGNTGASAQAIERDIHGLADAFHTATTTVKANKDKIAPAEAVVLLKAMHHTSPKMHTIARHLAGVKPQLHKVGVASVEAIKNSAKMAADEAKIFGDAFVAVLPAQVHKDAIKIVNTVDGPLIKVLKVYK